MVMAAVRARATTAVERSAYSCTPGLWIPEFADRRVECLRHSGRTDVPPTGTDAVHINALIRNQRTHRSWHHRSVSGRCRPIRSRAAPMPGPPEAIRCARSASRRCCPAAGSAAETSHPWARRPFLQLAEAFNCASWQTPSTSYVRAATRMCDRRATGRRQVSRDVGNLFGCLRAKRSVHTREVMGQPQRQ